jgi:hypothetical protein
MGRSGRGIPGTVTVRLATPDVRAVTFSDRGTVYTENRDGSVNREAYGNPVDPVHVDPVRAAAPLIREAIRNGVFAGVGTWFESGSR